MWIRRRSVTGRHNYYKPIVRAFSRTSFLQKYWQLLLFFVHTVHETFPADKFTLYKKDLLCGHCLSMSRVFRRDSPTWSFTQHPHRADNDCMIQQELPFHSIIFVAVSTWNFQTTHFQQYVPSRSHKTSILSHAFQSCSVNICGY